MVSARNTRELLAEINELLGLLDDSLADGEGAPDFHLDGDGRVLDVSARAADWLEVTRSGLVGRPLGTVADVRGRWAAGARIEIQRGARSYAGVLEALGDAADGVLALRLESAAASSADADPLRMLIHDLANVLGVIRGHAELTRMLADDAVVEAMDEVLAAVARGEALLNAAQPHDDEP